MAADVVYLFVNVFRKLYRVSLTCDSVLRGCKIKLRFRNIGRKIPGSVQTNPFFLETVFFCTYQFRILSTRIPSCLKLSILIRIGLESIYSYPA